MDVELQGLLSLNYRGFHGFNVFFCVFLLLMAIIACFKRVRFDQLQYLVYINSISNGNQIFFSLSPHCQKQNEIKQKINYRIE